jgi:hypothetical protein
MNFNGFGSNKNSSIVKSFKTLGGQELFRLDNPDKEAELEREAKRLFKITEDLRAAFDQACTCLQAAFVDKFGAGQLAMINDDLLRQRKAWIVPIEDTDENIRRVEALKEESQFRAYVDYYHRTCPLSPHQAMVVQFLENGEFKTVYRLREDIQRGL